VPPKDYGDGDDEGMDDMGFHSASSVVDNLEVRDQVPSMIFDDANTEVLPVVKKKSKKANSAVAGTFLRIRANSNNVPGIGAISVVSNALNDPNE
jgi:hypothetical protein